MMPFLTILTTTNTVVLILLLVTKVIATVELLPKTGLVASQSGTFDMRTSVASFAVDGLNSTCSIACTGCGGLAPGEDKTYGWLQVDLQRPYEIQAVALIASSDFTNSQYLKNLAILVRNDNSTSVSKPSSDDLCNRLGNINVTTNQFIRVNCTKTLIGRYLTFKREGDPRKDAFSTCEVFVWASSLGTSTKPRGESTKPGINPGQTTATNLGQTTPILDTSFPKGGYTRDEIIGISLGANFGFFILLIIGGIILFGFFSFKERRLPEDKIKVCPKNSNSETTISGQSATSFSNQSQVRADEFYHHVKLLRDMDSKDLLKLFMNLPEDELYEVTEARKSVNLCKNCFQNVLPYDTNRVQINGLTSDYINASYVKGFNGQHKYIATQDPIDVTIDDFWTMIWNNKVTRIVTLSNSSRFWPEVKESYGCVSVTMVTEEKYSLYNKRLFVLETQDDGGSEVIQFEYLESDFFKTPFHFLSFVNQVRCSGGGINPIVVHCSAGIGRTGCYVAVDFLLDELESRDHVGVVTCVELLRHQRMNSVQTLEQFSFVYDVMLEKIQLGRASLTWPKLVEKLERVMKVKVRGKLELDRRHQVLKEFVGNDLGRHGRENLVNRDDVHLHSYKKKNAYWLRKVPDVSQFDAFWRSLYDAKVDVCVVHGVNVKNFWPIEVQVEHCYDVIGVTCKELNFSASDVIKTSRYQLVNYSEVNGPGHRLTIMHLECNLPSTPNDPFYDNVAASHVADLYTRISVKSYPSSLSIAFVCHDGVTHSGMLAAAFYLLDVLKIERAADVNGACRHVTSVVPQAISTATQYKFIHQVLLYFLKRGIYNESSDSVKIDNDYDVDVKGVTFDPIGSSFI